MVFQDSYNLRRDVDKLMNKTDELATDYFIQVNSAVITYKDEVYTPSTVIATAYQSSREITDFYDDGILDLWESKDGGNTFTQVKQTTNHTISQMISDTTVTNYRINLYDSDLNLLDRQSIVIVRTTKGSAGQGYDFIYYTTEKEVIPSSDYPDGDITKLYGKYNEWLQSAKAIDTLHPNVFMCYRISDEEGKWGSWSTPVKYNARGERGEDGEGLEMIFCRTEYEDGYNLDPSTLAAVDTDDYVPNLPNSTEWSDDQRGVNSQYCFEYMCMRTKVVEDGEKEAHWGKFNSPSLWATFSEDGKDGKGIELIFARNNNPSSAPLFSNKQDEKTYTGTDRQGKHFNDDDFIPDGWFDDQQGVDEDNQCEWMAKRVKKVSNGVASWESFNTPQLWATFSEDGADGEDATTVMLGNEAQLIAVGSNGQLKTNPTKIEIPVYCYKGITRTAGTISLSNVSNTFSSKTVTKQPTASQDGLITLQCTTVPNQITNDEPITITVNGKTFTKYFTWSKIGDGKDGNDGGTFDFVYYTKNDATPPTISSSTTINDNTNKNVVGTWCARPTNVSSSYMYCFGAYRKLDANRNPTGDYSDVFLWAKYGATGSSGTSHEYAYYTTSRATNDAPTKPTGNVTDSTDTEKWTTVPVAMTPEKKYMYISYRIDGGNWSDTALWSQFGEKGETGARGQDGVGLEHIFYLSNKSPEEENWENISSYKNPVNWTFTQYNDNGTTKRVADDDFYLESWGWSDDATGVDETHMYEYCSIRTKTPDSNGVGKWGAFSQPKLWAKFGAQGEKGEDGIGYEIIFCRATTLNGYSSDPSSLPANPNADYVPTGWHDDAQGVDSTNIYEYCCTRTSNPDGTWNQFTSPTIWAKFGEDGEQGIPGVDGDDTSSNAVMYKVEDGNFKETSLGGMSDSVPSDFVASVVENETLTMYSEKCLAKTYIDGGEIIISRQGNIVTVFFNNLTVNNNFQVDTSINGVHTPIFLLPTWARPSNVVYFSSVLNNSVFSCSTTHIRIRRLSSHPNMSGSVTYMVNSEVGKENCTITRLSSLALAQGGEISVKLTSGSTDVVLGILYFRINGVVYKRVTDIDGLATLNVNLPSGSYPVLVWFDGGKYDANNQQFYGNIGNLKYTYINPTITVSKATGASITWGEISETDGTKYYAQFNNLASGSYPIRKHTVYLNLGGSGWRSAETDNDGRAYFRLNGFHGSTTVQAKIEPSNRITNGKTASMTYGLS